MAESTLLEDIETGKKEKQVRFFKAKVLEGHDGEEINETIKESIGNQSIVFTDKSTSYVDIADFVELHITEKSNKETKNELKKDSVNKEKKDNESKNENIKKEKFTTEIRFSKDFDHKNLIVFIDSDHSKNIEKNQSITLSKGRIIVTGKQIGRAHV